MTQDKPNQDILDKLNKNPLTYAQPVIDLVNYIIDNGHRGLQDDGETTWEDVLLNQKAYLQQHKEMMEKLGVAVPAALSGAIKAIDDNVG